VVTHVPCSSLRFILRFFAFSFFVTFASAQTFVTQTNVNTTGSGQQSETSIAINPKDANNIIAGANNNAGTTQVVVVSADGGINWKTANLPLTDSNGNTFQTSTDPRLAFDKDGNAYFAYVLFDRASGTLTTNPAATRNALVVSKSTDKGVTWSNPTPIVENLSEPFPLEDRQAIAVDQKTGKIYVTWTHFYKAPAVREALGGAVYISSSSDGGVSFSTPRSLTPRVPFDSVQYSMPAVAPDGDVYVVWASWYPHQILISRSIDHGYDFSPPVVVGQFMRIPEPRYTIPAQPNRGIGPAPAIACDNDGAIYVTWPDLASGDSPGSADIDIYVRKSVNKGLGWDTLGTDRKRVNNDGRGASQFNVSMAIDASDNSVNIAYYDTRLDPTNASTNFFMSRSTDGGQSFTDIQVASAPSREPAGIGGNDYGDYTGIAAANGIVFPVWTDRRTLTENIFVARIADCGSPAVIPVTNTSDNGPGSLRSALLMATGCDRIVFNIPQSAPPSPPSSFFTIQALARLPAITGSKITVDGETENTFLGGNPNPLGGPSIILDGSLLTASGSGLTINSGATETIIRGLSIVGFKSGNGIDVAAANAQVRNCWIGEDSNGFKIGNQTGIRLRPGADRCEISDSVVSRSLQDGLLIESNDNKIGGNRIGVDEAGVGSLPNIQNGIQIKGKRNLIGRNDVTGFSSNLISGNGDNGILINGGSDNIIGGNKIGTNLAGTAAIANGKSGIRINSSSGNSIGTRKLGGGGANLISGNSGDGISIFDKCRENEVSGNYIGVSLSGDSPLANGGSGISLDNEAVHNFIGRPDAHGINVISANGANGITIAGELTTANTIQNNRIGTDATGSNPLGNKRNGVELLRGASENRIGGSGLEGNIIAFNSLNGVRIEGGTSNTIAGNSIHHNASLGINLIGGNEDANGVTLNDDQDPDSGANGLQNYPSLAVRRYGDNVDLSFEGKPNTTYSFELFANDDADPSGFGQGQTRIEKVDNITTDSSGHATVGIVVPLAHRGKWMTATATGSEGTSEFSRAATAEIQRSWWTRFWRAVARLFGFRRARP
jgi:hypothetical protein